MYFYLKTLSTKGERTAQTLTTVYVTVACRRLSVMSDRQMTSVGYVIIVHLLQFGGWQRAACLNANSFISITIIHVTNTHWLSSTSWCGLSAASACFVFTLGAARLYLGDAHLTWFSRPFRPLSQPTCYTHTARVRMQNIATVCRTVSQEIGDRH